MKSRRARRVEVVTFEAVQLLDVAGPVQAFATANEIAAHAGDPRPYEIRIVARETSRVTSSAGLVLMTEALPPPGVAVDTLIVAGGPGARGDHDVKLVKWLARRALKARRVASVCTGAYLLAAAGLLDGRRAATHWSFCKDLARRYPSVRVEADPIFVRDGPVWTSAGVTAGIDLTLALLEEDLGREMAMAVARRLVMFLKRPGGQAQFSVALSLQERDTPFCRLHEWIGANLDADLSLSRLASEAGMSERSFSRRYVEATGLTPRQAVERVRVEAARRLLSDGRTPIKSIARKCGFGSEETMRRSFQRLLATSPQDYRARFSA